MKRTFLSKVQVNGRYYIAGAALLLVAVPLYQFLVLQPQGYSDALASTQQGSVFSGYLLWIQSHMAQFLGYRALLILAFALLLSLPFTLFRIIVAQEVLEPRAEEADEIQEADEEAVPDNDMPPFAWRGKGFAVIAAWAGLSGIALSALGTLAGTIYLAMTGAAFHGHAAAPTSFSALSSTFTLLTYTVGGGFLALALLFFGAVIARRGRRLWPGVWVAFSYGALVLAALFSGSAVAVADAPGAGQATLTSPSILLFGVWVLWFGIMLVRLKPEP